jgi:hypothetical protein
MSFITLDKGLCISALGEKEPVDLAPSTFDQR